jgi:hypothetical protein
MQAETAMKEVHRETSEVPELMNIFEAPKEERKLALVPANLERMGEIATRCASKVRAVFGRISEATDALSKLAEFVHLAFGEVHLARRQAVANAAKRSKDNEEEDFETTSDDHVEVVRSSMAWRDRKIAAAVERFGCAADIAEQLLSGKCDAGGRAKSLLEMARPSFLSDSYVVWQRNKMQVKKVGLRRAKIEAESAKERLLENTKKLVKTVSELGTSNAEACDRKQQSLAVIRKGTAALDAMRTRWKYLLTFFHNIVIQAKVSRRAQMGLNRFAPAYDAAGMGYFTNALAQYYCEVSPKHFIPLAVKLVSLAGLDPVKDSDRINGERKALKEAAEAMQTRVERLAIELKEIDDAKTEKRMAERERVFEERVPDISYERQEEIESTLRIAFLSFDICAE